MARHNISLWDDERILELMIILGLLSLYTVSLLTNVNLCRLLKY